MGVKFDRLRDVNDTKKTAPREELDSGQPRGGRVAREKEREREKGR